MSKGKTIFEILAEIAEVSVEDIMGSEPVNFHQGEVIKAVDQSTQALREEVEKLSTRNTELSLRNCEHRDKIQSLEKENEEYKGYVMNRDEALLRLSKRLEELDPNFHDPILEDISSISGDELAKIIFNISIDKLRALQSKLTASEAKLKGYEETLAFGLRHLYKYEGFLIAHSKHELLEELQSAITELQTLLSGTKQ